MKTAWIVVLLLAGVVQVSAQAAERDRFLYKDTPWTVLETLKRGNARFISQRLSHPHTDAARRQLAVTSNQAHYVLGTVLSCSDSRVPVELIFDVGIMDLNVLRVPGNTCGKNEAAGIEYNVKHTFTPLILVLGHTDCVEIAAAMSDEAQKKLSPNTLELIKPIRKVAERVKNDNKHLTDEELIAVCTKENVFEAIKELLTRSPDLLELAMANKIAVAGAVYDLKTGKMDWLDRWRVAEIIKSLEPPKPEPKAEAPAK